MTQETTADVLRRWRYEAAWDVIMKRATDWVTARRATLDGTAVEEDAVRLTVTEAGLAEAFDALVTWHEGPCRSPHAGPAGRAHGAARGPIFF